MKYMLIIYIILNPSTDSEKNIEIKIPHETYESCIKASKKTEFKFSLPNFKFGSESKCILNKNYKESEIET